jgi:hypothetical protein
MSPFVRHALSVCLATVAALTSRQVLAQGRAPEPHGSDRAPADPGSDHAEAAASDHNRHEDPDHDAPHAHPRFLVGASGGYTVAFAEHEIHHLGGGGLAFEAIAIPRWLAIELVVRGMTSGHGANLPITLLAKKPFHASKAIHPFVGLGPTVVPSFGEDGTSVHFGGVVVAGAHFWIAPHWALLAEVEYGLVYEHGIVHELGMSAGVAFGW